MSDDTENKRFRTHIRTAGEARAAVAAAHHGAGGRGYAGSSRAAGYTTRATADHLARSAGESVLVAQIEDVEAVESIEAIVVVPGVDALFIGRVLTVAMGAASQDDPRVVAAVQAVCRAGRAAGRTVGMFLSRPTDPPGWAEKGASFLLLGSDHSFIPAGAARMRNKRAETDAAWMIPASLRSMSCGATGLVAGHKRSAPSSPGSTLRESILPIKAREEVGAYSAACFGV